MSLLTCVCMCACAFVCVCVCVCTLRICDSVNCQRKQACEKISISISLAGVRPQSGPFGVAMAVRNVIKTTFRGRDAQRKCQARVAFNGGLVSGLFSPCPSDAACIWNTRCRLLQPEAIIRSPIITIVTQFSFFWTSSITGLFVGNS